MLSILFPTMATIKRRASRSLYIILLICFTPLPVCGLTPIDPVKSVADKDREVFRVVQDFMVTVRKGHIAQAYQVFTSHDFRETASLNQFVSFISRYPALRRNRSVDLIKIQYHENVAVINATVSSLEHQDDIAQFVVRYEEGRWRIISIQIFPPKAN